MNMDMTEIFYRLAKENEQANKKFEGFVLASNHAFVRILGEEFG